MEPAFPQLPRPGRPTALPIHGSVAIDRLCGSLSLEISNHQFRAGSARGAIDGYRALLLLLDQLRARTGIGPQGPQSLPPRSKCLGTEFIKFAIDEMEAVAFEAVLKGLACAGVQGEIGHALAAGCQQQGR